MSHPSSQLTMVSWVQLILSSSSTIMLSLPCISFIWYPYYHSIVRSFATKSSSQSTKCKVSSPLYREKKRRRYMLTLHLLLTCVLFFFSHLASASDLPVTSQVGQASPLTQDSMIIDDGASIATSTASLDDGECTSGCAFLLFT